MWRLRSGGACRQAVGQLAECTGPPTHVSVRMSRPVHSRCMSPLSVCTQRRPPNGLPAYLRARVYDCACRRCNLRMMRNLRLPRCHLCVCVCAVRAALCDNQAHCAKHGCPACGTGKPSTDEFCGGATCAAANPLAAQTPSTCGHASARGNCRKQASPGKVCGLVRGGRMACQARAAGARPALHRHVA